MRLTVTYHLPLTYYTPFSFSGCYGEGALGLAANMFLTCHLWMETGVDRFVRGLGHRLWLFSMRSGYMVRATTRNRRRLLSIKRAWALSGEPKNSSRTGRYMCCAARKPCREIRRFKKIVFSLNMTDRVVSSIFRNRAIGKSRGTVAQHHCLSLLVKTQLLMLFRSEKQATV